MDGGPGVLGPQRGNQPHTWPEFHGARHPHRPGAGRVARPAGGRHVLHRPCDDDRACLRDSLQDLRKYARWTEPPVRDHSGGRCRHHPSPLGTPEVRCEGAAHGRGRDGGALALPLRRDARDTPTLRGGPPHLRSRERTAVVGQGGLYGAARYPAWLIGGREGAPRWAGSSRSSGPS